MNESYQKIDKLKGASLQFGLEKMKISSAGARKREQQKSARKRDRVVRKEGEKGSKKAQ